MLKRALALAKESQKIDNLDLLLILLLRKNRFSKIIFDTLHKQKVKNFENEIISNRKLTVPKVLYLCSVHTDCAEDHKDYQGKVYVDKDYDKNDKILENYIKLNDIKTIQEIISSPVYLFTRPNCRHYFVPFSKEEILSCDIDTILEKHDMKERYDTQVDKANIVRKRIDHYNKKIRLYNKLKSVYSTPKLEQLLKKAKNSRKKWLQDL